jgi:putative heme-binding domain-containing protein
MHKFVLFSMMFSLSAGVAGARESFELRDGDRIALVGDTLIEREQESGWLETEMAADFADRHFIVRNLGWSADTPAGASRASFDFADPQKGFDLLAGEIAQVKPTVVILGYGMASSFAGEAGLAQFKSEFNRLIDKVQAGASNQVRFVVISPLRHQALPPPLPDPAGHNAQLALYTETLREIAVARGIPFVDLFDWKPSLRARDLTDNGIHLTPAGYRCMAAEVGRQLGWPSRLGKTSKNITGALRQEIIRKNQLFFDRWRPQNETYLFGFRKQEQGQNAHEIPEFDPLVMTADESIAHFQDLLHAGAKSPPRVTPNQPAATRALVPLPLPDFTVAPGFEVNLWAEDPLLAKPIQMNFDPQGRLWVASSSVYPQISPGQTADDKIVVLEDTKGWGRADKATVFADGLFIPQGVEPGDGGCYVGQSTELLHFTGAVGRGKASQRRVVLSGFGTEDSHHMVHTLAWGPDGMLYFNQSIYIHSHIETPHGVVRLNSGGVFHLRPSTMQLDIYLRGFWNPWGDQFDSFGQSFITDGAGTLGINWGIAGATYAAYVDMRRELPSISPGPYPKFCGLEIVASQQFPDDWQGDFLTADFRAHRVVRFSVTDDGAGYVTKEMPDVLTSTNVTFRPVDLKFGPDGALYVADWSNPIINHGEVDFRDPRRDHEHGRIWRITAKGRPLLLQRNLARLSTGKLFDELLSPNLYEAQQARRVLTERGKNITGALQKWIARQNYPKAWLEALWIYQSIGARNDALLDKVLQAPDGRIRAAAVRVLNYWPRTTVASAGPDKGLPVPSDCYERALADPFPRVRLEAVRAVGSIPSVRSAELALDVLERPMDPFLDYALWLTVNDLAKPWLEGLRSGAWNIAGRQKQTEFALNAIKPELVGSALNDILKIQPLTRNGKGPWIELIGRAGLPEDVDLLYQKMLEDGFDTVAAARAGAALNEAAVSRGVKPKSGLEKIVKFFGAPDQQIRIEAVHLAGNWRGSASLVAQLAALAGAAETPPPVREAAFASLKKIGGQETIRALQPLTATNETPKIRQSAVLTLAALDVSNCGPNAVSVLSGLTNEEAALPVWRDLLGITGSDPVLAAALPRSGFPTAIGKAGMRAVRESGRSEPELLVALTRAAGLQGAEAALTPAEVKKLGETVLNSGDAARGERIFRRPQQSCLSCHAIGGAGGKVGPDLTPIGASSPVDYLIDSVLYPNKDIKDGYQSYVIETTDGEELSGIPVRENERELVLRNAADQQVTVLKKQIKSKKAGGSLMPSGLVDNLTGQEQLDLYRFLSALGKPPFDASKGNVARLWETSPDPAQSADEQKLLDSALTGEPWHRLTSLVNGRMLGDDLENAALSGKRSTNSTILAGTRFRSVKSGPVRFDLSAPAGTPAWIDGKPVHSDKFILTDLPAGVHTIIVKLEGKGIPDAIRLQSDDGTFLGN